MLAAIKGQLKALEADRQIHILLAAESGSRAWGFPSPDSDYDVRIIYIHEPDWYLSIQDKKDSIDYFHGELLDIGGWEIRKTLRLVKKSNATPFEWAQSPIIYQEADGFRDQLLKKCAAYFQPYHTINHYKGIAKNNFLKDKDDQQIKLKKLFYVLRPLFSIEWILKNNSLPPMNIFDLMEAVDDTDLKEDVKNLIQLKAEKNEDYRQEIPENIDHYIDRKLTELDQLNPFEKRTAPEVGSLDNFFRALLNQA